MADELEQTRCGKFGYENISGHAYAIPYILRNNEKLCASKIFEWHFDKHKHSLKPSLVNFGYLKGYEMHREEACLIDEINGWHNNNMYGRLSETLVKMDDVRNIFKYVNDCTKKRKEGDKFTMIAGMARIRLSLDRDDIILPYISKNGQRYVPIHSLNPLPSGLVVTTLTDIDVMYIRYLFDVLKIPLPHQKFEMPCVSLDQLIAQLSKNAGGYYDYDDKHWPTKEIPAKLNNNDLPFFSITTNNNYSQEKALTVKRKHSITKNVTVKITRLESHIDQTADEPTTDKTTDKTTDEPKKVELSKQDEQTPKRMKESPAEDVQPLEQYQQLVNKDRRPKEKGEAEVASKESNQKSESKRNRDKSETPPKQFVEPGFYEVDYLRDYRKKKNGREEVLVHWKGFSSENDTWEPVTNLNSELKTDVELLRKKCAIKPKAKKGGAQNK